VSIGDVYFEKNRNLIFGPAIEQAYLFESKIAKYPRIIIDEESAGKYLEMEENHYKNMDTYFAEKALEANGRIILKDIDDKYYLNYFNSMKQGLVYSEIHSFKDYYNDLLNFSNETVLNYAIKLKNCMDENDKNEISKIIDKHNWFIDYLKKSEPPKYNIPVIVMSREKITNRNI
jgi:hypothetical protein